MFAQFFHNKAVLPFCILIFGNELLNTAHTWAGAMKFHVMEKQMEVFKEFIFSWSFISVCTVNLLIYHSIQTALHLWWLDPGSSHLCAKHAHFPGFNFQYKVP